MDRPDIKTICGAGFGSPEVQEIMLRELRATDTVSKMSAFPDVASLFLHRQPRPTSGLVEWYEMLSKTKANA